jgi:hypothetical protein
LGIAEVADEHRLEGIYFVEETTAFVHEGGREGAAVFGVGFILNIIFGGISWIVKGMTTRVIVVHGWQPDGKVSEDESRVGCYRRLR